MESWGALTRAAETGDLETLRAMLADGVHPDARVLGPLGPLDPLIVNATRFGQFEAVRLLLDAGAAPEPAMPGAVSRGRLDIVELLVAHGASEPAELPDPDELLPDALDRAIELPGPASLAVLEDLLRRGAKTVPGREPILVVAIGERATPAVLRTLLAHGADPDVRALDGTPALVLAAKRDNAAAVDVLLEHGADPDAADRRGHTALMHAAAEKFDDVLAVLFTRGAEPTVRLDDGTRAVVPIHWERRLLGSRLRRALGDDVPEAPSDVMRVIPETFRLSGDPQSFADWAEIVEMAAADANTVEWHAVSGGSGGDLTALAARLAEEHRPSSQLAEDRHELALGRDDLAAIRTAAKWVSQHRNPPGSATRRARAADLYHLLGRALRG